MGLFAKISVPGIDSPVVLGSVHTLCTNAVAIQEYIGIHPAIVAGDQNWNVCREWGLRPATTSTKATWFESTPPNGGGKYWCAPAAWDELRTSCAPGTRAAAEPCRHFGRPSPGPPHHRLLVVGHLGD